MKLTLSLMSLMLATASVPVTAADVDSNVAEARSIIKQFAGQLKGELQTAMKAGGPVAAIKVCNEKAPEIARQLSEASSWNVARTSLKIRNTSNVPLAWEQQVLKDFEQRKTSGEVVKTMDYTATVEVDGKKVFRYMKPIPTQQVCTKCHGEVVDEKVEAALKALYPVDRARGYVVGDIRGAFSLNKTL